MYVPRGFEKDEEKRPPLLWRRRTHVKAAKGEEAGSYIKVG